MESGRVVYCNGEFVPEKDAKISIYDSALMFGDMVFEMTRSFNKRQFKLQEHLERLLIGAKILHIPLGLTVTDIEEICFETMARNQEVFDDTDEHRLLINISRGPLGLYSSIFGEELGPTIVVADFPLKWTVAGMAPLYDTGINAVIPSQRAIPATFLDPKIKNRSRLFYQMANIEVSKVKGENNWALLLDGDGFVAEGTGDNFFIVKDGELLTPEGRNILRGISRAYIFDIARQIGIACRECNLEPYDVITADEAFMTATPFCILPVTGLNGAKIGSGKRGVITDRLLRTWSENVGLDIEQQIRNYAMEIGQKRLSSPTPYRFN